MKSSTAVTEMQTRELQVLRRWDELLRLAMEVGRIGVFETDLKQQRTHFSPELCAIIGLPNGTVMPTEKAWQFVHEADRGGMRAIAEAAAKSPHEGKWSGVHRLRRTDGKILWVSANGRRIYRKTRNGLQPVRSMGVIIDITHLKEVEEALRESELRLRFALEAAQMGTFVADMTAGEVSIDALEARLLGLPDETRCVSTELLGKRIAVMDLTESDAKGARLFQDDEPYRHELRLQMQDGSERWLSTHADVRSNRVFGINFDITRRKQAEARLRDSEERLRIATSGAALGVFEWDTETDHASFENERMYEIFGHRRGDGALCLRQFVDNSLHPQDADLFETALTTAHQSADGFHTTVRIRRADGEERWLQIDAALHESTPGRRSRLLGVMADVTERKALEERTKQLSDYLVTIQESERQRIAQELHDSTAQHLVAAGLNLMSLRPSGSSGETAKLWDETEACLQEAMKELRTFSHLMHPPALEYDGLCSTLRQYVDRFGNRSGLEIKIRVNSKLDQLPAHLQRTLLRIIQEALGNVHRHAAASQAIVDLRFIGERIHLLVTDNGCGGDGLETWGPSKSGGGITGMRTRVDQYDGKFQIRMGPSGTTIRVVIPARSGREKGRLERPRLRRASLQRHEA